MDNSKYDLHVPPNIHAPAGRLTLVAGPVASGKTRFVRALIKEAVRMRPKAHVLVVDTTASWGDLKKDFTKKEISKILVSQKSSVEDVELFLLGKSEKQGTLTQIANGNFDCSLVVIDDVSSLHYDITAGTNQTENKLRHFLNQLQDGMRPLSAPLILTSHVRKRKEGEASLFSRLRTPSLMYMADMVYETCLNPSHEDYLLKNAEGITVGNKLTYKKQKCRNGHSSTQEVEVWYDYTTGRAYSAEELEFTAAEVYTRFK